MLLLLGAVISAFEQITRPGDLCVPVAPISPDVPLPPDGDPGTSDLYSMLWKTFIAINWPADTRKGRGVALDGADPQVYARTDVPRVWETWKQSWETNDDQLEPWDSYRVASPPCDTLVLSDTLAIEVTTDTWPTLYKRYGGTVLNLVNTVNESTDEDYPFTLGGPIIDSGGSTVLFEIRYNRELYDCVAHLKRGESGGSSGCAKHGDRFVMPGASSDNPGAISVKASWRKATSEEKSSYHYREVLVLDHAAPDGASKKVCRLEGRVLLGMHIAYKDDKILTRNRENFPCKVENDGYSCMNQWVWATFENKQNVSMCPDSGPCINGYNYEPDPIVRTGAALGECPVCGGGVLGGVRPEGAALGECPVSLCRIKEITDLGQDCNNNYQAQLAPYPPWPQYGIITLQWLIGGQANPGKYVANVTIEPYAQQDDCMGCHNGPKIYNSDFVWSLQLARTNQLFRVDPRQVDAR